MYLLEYIFGEKLAFKIILFSEYLNSYWLLEVYMSVIEKKKKKKPWVERKLLRIFHFVLNI